MRQAMIVGCFIGVTVILTGWQWASSADENNTDSQADPIEIRRQIIETHIAILKTIPSEAETLTAEQEAAVGVLSAYRAEEAAPELVRIITAKSPVQFSPGGSGGTYGKREKYGDEEIASAALTKIGIPGVCAILDDISGRDQAAPSETRLTLYARTIVSVFPGNVGLDYVRTWQQMTPAGRKRLYDPLIQTMEKMSKPVIQLHDQTKGSSAVG
jgi:hypothetical protein